MGGYGNNLSPEEPGHYIIITGHKEFMRFSLENLEVLLDAQ